MSLPSFLVRAGRGGEVTEPARGAPDGGVLLLVTDVRVLGEEDGVVGYCGLARGQDAPDQVAHHGQDPIVHEQVIHQELDRQRKACVACGLSSPSSFPRVTSGKVHHCSEPRLLSARPQIFTTTRKGTWISPTLQMGKLRLKGLKSFTHVAGLGGKLGSLVPQGPSSPYPRVASGRKSSLHQYDSRRKDERKATLFFSG